MAGFGCRGGVEYWVQGLTDTPDLHRLIVSPFLRMLLGPVEESGVLC